MPRLMCYARFFLGIVCTEGAILAIQFFLQRRAPSIDLTYLAVSSIIAMVLFLIEGLLLRRKTKLENSAKQER